MAETVFLFRIDLGYNAEKGYGATVLHVPTNRIKGIKGNSIRNLLRGISKEVAEEEQKMRRFPLEQETRSIITPGDGDPLLP